MSDIRQASLQPGSSERLPGLAVRAGPFAILLVGAFWAYRRFDDLPARIPVHWNWHGQVDRWVSRTPLGVALPLLLGAALCTLMLAMQYGLLRSSPRGSMRGASIKLIAAGQYLVALLCCGILGTSLTSGRLFWALLAFSLLGALAVAGYAVVLARRGAKEPLRNPGAWRGGVFYADREDPALFVPKRSGFGHTFNFGHPMAVVLTLLLLLVPLVFVAAAFLVR